MSPLRLTGSTSGYSQIDAPAVAGDQTFTLPGTGGTLDRLNRAGNILQVVSATYSTSVSSTSSSYTNTGLEASITPTSSSSRIIVLGFINGVNVQGAANTGIKFGLYKGTSATILQTFALYSMFNTSSTNTYAGTASTSFVDSPATTSSTTYGFAFARSTGTATAYVQLDGSSSTSSMILLEVAA